MALTPNALVATGLSDLVAATLRDLGRGRFTEIATDLQVHTAMRNLLKKNRVVFQSGVGAQWDVMVNHNQSAANVGIGSSDSVNIVDTLIQAQVDWRGTTANYGIFGQEPAMNREPARIVDLIKARRIACMISLAELMEGNFWGPPPQSTDVLTPYGVNYWIVKNATEGFNGATPTGYTTVGNINPTTYPRWQNWTYQYTAVSRDDLIRHWRKAATFTNFQPPVDGIPTFDTGDIYGFYTNYGVIGPLEEALESQNDNLGEDVASQDGRTLFRRVPVTWVPKLEADTTNPVYGIDWGVFKTMVLSGWWLKETFIPHYPGQHRDSAVFVDCFYNWLCRDRRRNFVLATGTTYPS
jgi:hypothetical protein